MDSIVDGSEEDAATDDDSLTGEAGGDSVIDGAGGDSATDEVDCGLQSVED